MWRKYHASDHSLCYSQPTKLIFANLITILTSYWSRNIVYVSQEPVIDTSLDDAFASMMQFMTISSRKCKVSSAGSSTASLPSLVGPQILLATRKGLEKTLSGSVLCAEHHFGVLFVKYVVGIQERTMKIMSSCAFVVVYAGKHLYRFFHVMIQEVYLCYGHPSCYLLVPPTWQPFSVFPKGYDIT